MFIFSFQRNAKQESFTTSRRKHAASVLLVRITMEANKYAHYVHLVQAQTEKERRMERIVTVSYNFPMVSADFPDSPPRFSFQISWIYPRL